MAQMSQMSLMLQIVLIVLISQIAQGTYDANYENSTNVVSESNELECMIFESCDVAVCY